MVNTESVLRRDGAVLWYRDLPGPRRPVVFVHGAGMDHRMFEAPALALHRAGHRVVLWDLRGHGASTLDTRFTATAALDDLVALLDHLAVRRPVLIGHSLGGNLAQALVRRLPDHAHGLIVLDATRNTGPLSTAERFLLGLAAPALALVPASRLPRLMARASATTPRGIAESERTFARIPKHVFLDVWRATTSLVDPDPAYRTPIPLGLVRGAHDRTGNIATAMPRWAAAEGVSEHVIPDAGHNVTLDAPAATTAVISTLLDRWEHTA
ncbi:alpha/beta fold hydrolase [Saccharothrix obliqua]|uniref:alpha/beta fold hydrolase n=1 Tax=Saccharothrix obliqua TaxID=2861747 RepID=UPI001C5DEE01|nr:alpha/beta hydrolase [Saccharothrix obliqua]MBW4717277.1 alpha/beta hydrolase [Saccharothrix obliqua]